MRIFVLTVIAALLWTGCRETNPVIEVTKTRRLTLYDKDPAGNILDKPPLGWRTIPPTKFRDKNFLAGPDEKVEIYVSNVNGDLLQNANRWLGQFGQQPVANLAEFETLMILKRTSILVEAQGIFGAAMGGGKKEERENYALIGALRPTNSSLLSFKMVGPAEAVAGLRTEFIEYCETMKVMDVTSIESDEEDSE
ncbi:MAG: hypothetical protein ACON4R_02280 [Akkermansiaceae bacterium]